MIGSIALHHADDPSLQARLTDFQKRALNDIAACSTAACGLHEMRCDHCGDICVVPNTCGNRSCPICQAGLRAAWVQAREKELLPCGYFHVIFTLPDPLRQLALMRPAVVLDCLLRASADAVLYLAADPRFLGAQVGILSLLHTWNRRLDWHPHVHLMVTAGGLKAAGSDQAPSWVPAKTFGPERTPFLVPEAVLRTTFRRRLMRLLLDAFQKGKLDGLEVFPHLANLVGFRRWLAKQADQRWCLHIQRPFGSAQHLVRYLGAYISRAAITPSRIMAHDPAANVGAGSVTFLVSRPHQPKDVRTMTGVDFLAAFARHVLPPHFVRIRFCGIWATAHRKRLLDQAYRALTGRHRPQPDATPRIDQNSHDRNLCPVCRIGHYQRAPGPCPRPTRAQRADALKQIRQQARTPKPPGAHPAA